MSYLDRIINLPKVCTGCYLLYKDNELVYVGVACNIHARLKQHELSNKNWNNVKYIEETDYLSAIQIENYFIDVYKPKFNKAGSKLTWDKIRFGNNFDIEKIPYPSGWNKKKKL
jgi:excinuclease UvrABC nuclease subunit